MKKKEIEEKEKLPPDEQMRLDLYASRCSSLWSA